MGEIKHRVELSRAAFEEMETALGPLYRFVDTTMPDEQTLVLVCPLTGRRIVFVAT